MGMRAVWIAFGAATFYVVGAVAVPIIIATLRGRGVEIDGSMAKNLTGLAALLTSALGGALGMHHALKVEARRDDS